MGITLLNLRLVTLRRAGALAAAYVFTVVIGTWLVVNSRYYGLPLAALPLIIGFPAWLAITRRTGLALSVVLAYLGLLDGVVKLKTGSQMATLGRDVLLYAVAIGMLIRARGPFRLPALGGWVVAWTVVLVIQVANPGNFSLLHAVVSLRQDLEFVPLFFIGFAVLRTCASLHAFFALLLAVAAINAPVAAYQGSLTPDQLSAWGPGYSALIHGKLSSRTFADAAGQLRVRPPGLGSDEGFGGELGALALPGGIALLVTYRRRRWLLGMIALGMIAAGIGVVTSEGRSVLITAIVALLATPGLLAVGRQGKRALIAVCLIGAIAAAAVNATSSYDSAAFVRYTSIAPSSAASTLSSSRGSSWALIPRYIREIPFGAGLGKLGPAAGIVSGMDTTFNSESQFTFLMVEAGIPGLLVFLAFQAALCSTIIRGLRRERDPRTVVLMAALAAPLFGLAVGWLVGPTTTQPPNAPYLWLAAGVISWWFVERQRTGGPALPAPTRTIRH